MLLSRGFVVVSLALLLVAAVATSDADSISLHSIGSLVEILASDNSAAAASAAAAARVEKKQQAPNCRCSRQPKPLSITGQSHYVSSLLKASGYPEQLIDRLLLTAAVTNYTECRPVSRLDNGSEEGEKNEEGRRSERSRIYVGCAGAAKQGGIKIVVYNATVHCWLKQFGMPVQTDDPLSLALANFARREVSLCLAGHPDLSRRPSSRRRRDLGAEDILRRGVSSFVSKFPWLQRLVATSETTEPIKRVTSRGFERFEQKVALQAIDGVSPSSYKEFVNFILTSIGADSEAKAAIRRGVFNLLPYMRHGDWQDFRMLFKAGAGGSTKYVNILAHNGGSGGYDFVIADFQTSFSLAPNLIVVEKSSSSMWGAFGSSETVIRKVPASIKDSDIEVLMTFFDLAAFRRFAKMLEVPLARRTRRMAAAGWIGAINAGISLYSKFAKAFSTKKTSKIVGKITGKGFDHFSMRSRAHLISSMHPNYLERYLRALPILYDLPKKYMPEFKVVLEMVRFVGSQDWNKNDFLFDVGKRGSNAWVTILSNRNADGTYNFLIANVQQTFKLAPNILIIKESKSVAGGIYQSEKYKFKRIPRSITEADIQMLTNFFNIITFKRFGLKFNVDTSSLDGN